MKPAALEAAVNALELTFADITAVHRVDESWRKSLIALRRRLEQEGRHVAHLIGELEDDGPHAGAVRNLKNEFSRLRSAVAHHQAAWPVIQIDPDDPRYTASEQSIHNAKVAFLFAVRTTIGTSRRPGSTPPT